MATTAVIIGEKKLKLYLKKVRKNLVHKKLLEEIGHFVDVRIQDRTLIGEDADGKFMGGYSESYELIRENKGLQSDHVDLFFTGSMYASLTHKIDENKVTSFFMPTKDKKGMSNPEKAFYNDQRFNFFALTNEDVQDVFKLVDDHIDKVL